MKKTISTVLPFMVLLIITACGSRGRDRSSDYADMEKGADLGVTLPQNNEQMNTQAVISFCIRAGRL